MKAGENPARCYARGRFVTRRRACLLDERDFDEQGDYRGADFDAASF